MRLPLPSLRSCTDLPAHWPAYRPRFQRRVPFAICLRAMDSLRMGMMGAEGSSLSVAAVLTLCKPLKG